METLVAMLRPDFLLHHALYGSVVVGFVCPLVGVYMVLRRLVYWGVALPQASTAGIAFAFMLEGFGFAVLGGGETHEQHLAIFGAVLFTVAAVAALAWLEARGGSSEGRVGTLFVLASAAALLFTAWNPAAEAEMLALLKGEIVTISESDFHAMLNTFALVALLLLAFRREFALVSFDRDMAVTLGRRVPAWEGLLYALIALSISLGVMTVGPLVVFGALVVPAMAALPWAGGMLSFSLLASVLGGLGAFAGFYVSYRWDLPLGPVIVCALGALQLASWGLRAAAGLARAK